MLGPGPSQLRSVTVVVEMWGSSRPTVERLEERMPSIVEEYQEELGGLLRRGVLRLAGAALNELDLPCSIGVSLPLNLELVLL